MRAFTFWMALCLCLPQSEAAKHDFSCKFNALAISATTLVGANMYAKTLKKLRLGLASLGIALAIAVPFVSRGGAKLGVIGGCAVALVSAAHMGRVANQIGRNHKAQSQRYFDEYMFCLDELAEKVLRLSAKLPADLAKLFPFQKSDKPHFWLDNLVMTIQTSTLIRQEFSTFMARPDGRAWILLLQEVQDLLVQLQDHFEDYLVPMRTIDSRGIFDPQRLLDDVGNFSMYSETLDALVPTEISSTAIRVDHSRAIR